MNNKFVRAVVALALSLLLAVPSLAEARYPAQGAALTDDANALSQTVAEDVAAYAQKAEDTADLKIRVALVYFLDGETPQAYADKLFTRWALDENSLLILGAAAEDTFAFSSGESVRAKLSNRALSGLAYTSGFADAFTAQRYDEAFGKFFIALNSQINKQYGTQIKLGGLFEAEQSGESQTAKTTAQTVVDSAYSLWTSTLNAVTGKAHDYEGTHRDSGNASGRFSGGGWIVLAVIALLLLGQRRSARRGRRCGCSPLGWVIGGLGLGALYRRGNCGETCRETRRETRREQRFERDRRGR